MLRFQGENYEAIYKVLPDLLAPFPNARAVDWQKSIANVPKEKRGELIKTLMKVETRTAKGRWQFAGRMAEVFESYKNARIDRITQGARRGISIVLFTDEQIAKELSARQAWGSVDVTINNRGIMTGPLRLESLHVGDETKANIGGDATNVAIGQRGQRQGRRHQRLQTGRGPIPGARSRSEAEVQGGPRDHRGQRGSPEGQGQRGRPPWRSPGRAGTAESRQGANPALSGVAQGHRAERRGDSLLGGQDRRAVRG